ncbi:3-phenylpropionate/cinnamic acid dioxygenase subunit beta [Sphingomonas sp. A2-49]|uniref:aromatic-ring-hydroxylating dioxygenase subunit beta n=1 Tax=Sphingomonas sp. A2-49 TaxID=1391375 RepID=UPI0021D2BF37|nr:3-phenylpropionate/cinnamic acid dioxygenase subunit beta [Sphingomonas sp. A2-49]MCU6453114.1 3-phenylpropionate/cinnamic acid dioxygenase subunit beta [Sphingomonas sp. A2-49]
MTTLSAVAEPETVEAPAARRVPIGSPLYNRLLETYYHEAEMLDELRFADWTDWLATDLRYTAPQRLTRLLADHDKSIDRSVMHFDESYNTIKARVKRLNGNSAFAEDPPSRTRRLVTNIRVETTATADEYKVRGYFLLTRSRFEQSKLAVMSGERHDIVRDLGERFELVSRETILDQAVLGMPNLAIFL